MTRLHELAQVLRSKNAGPFQITIDMMFDTPERYQRALASGVLSPARIAPLYGVPEHLVRVIPFERVHAIKVTIPRTMGTLGSGSAFDRDVYGAQQHGPLAELEIA